MLALLRPDAINKLRMEYELWCPICEQSAPVPTKIISASSFVESKREMQQSILGFIPDERVIVFATNNESLVERHSKASSVLTLLTTSMHCLYETELSPTSDFYRTREKVRLEMERFVNTHCSAYFPLGSRVMVFGSSANGFGSPTSDLDMCLQLPQSERNADLSSDDWFATKGRDAMQALADTLKSHGMKEVDTCRLTARIPVIMFRYPLPLTATGEEPLLDCDISMRNPLALLNTQFLRIYSMLDPRIPVLASIIKRWAKSRCINDPKTHTYVSYNHALHGCIS
jgi:DNA polymerase sigma